MGYLGKLPATQGKDAGPTLKIDDISGDFNGSKTAFDLKIDGTGVSPHINNIQIYLSGVHQQPTTAFTLAGSSSGSQVRFTSAPSSEMSFHGALIGDARLMTPDNWIQVNDGNFSPKSWHRENIYKEQKITIKNPKITNLFYRKLKHIFIFYILKRTLYSVYKKNRSLKMKNLLS